MTDAKLNNKSPILTQFVHVNVNWLCLLLVEIKYSITVDGGVKQTQYFTTHHLVTMDTRYCRDEDYQSFLAHSKSKKQMFDF